MADVQGYPGIGRPLGGVATDVTKDDADGAVGRPPCADGWSLDVRGKPFRL